MQYTSTQAQNEQLPVQHFDKIRHHCPIIAKSFLAFPPDFCKLRDIQRTIHHRAVWCFWSSCKLKKIIILPFKNWQKKRHRFKMRRCLYVTRRGYERSLMNDYLNVHETPFAKPPVPCVAAMQLCFAHKRASTSSSWFIKSSCKHGICMNLPGHVNYERKKKRCDEISPQRRFN